MTAPLQGIRTVALDAKLLALCNVCAAVRQPGPYQECSDAFDVARLLAIPLAFVAGPDGINAALIARLSEGTAVGFRGTLSPDDKSRDPEARLLDWLQDFEAPLVEWVGSTDCHQGFSAAVDSLASLDLFDEIPAGQPVIFCGHSKGGAMAQLAALKFWLQTGRQSTVTTFGAPRCGGASFGASFRRAPIDLLRYEGAGDVVPHVPFSSPAADLFADLLAMRFGAFDYESVGQAVYVREGELEPAAPRIRSAVDVALHFKQDGFDAVRKAHSINPGSNYWAGVMEAGDV